MASWFSRTRNRRLVAVGVAIVVLCSGSAAAAHAIGLDRLPDARSVIAGTMPADTLVYDRTGAVLLADLQPSGYQHAEVPLGAMGRWLPAATVAIDDPGFWTGVGPDTTIVPRLVRLRMGDDPGDFAARLRLAALAVRVAAAYSKPQILEAYLNSLPYGNQAYGAESAARTYFGVDASQLDLAEAALLAGLPQAPTRLDPIRNLSAARQRQREVLDAMVRAHAASRQRADQAVAEPLRISGPAALDLAPNLVAQLTHELSARVGKDVVDRGGLTVVSTLDWRLQQQAVQAVGAGVEANRARNLTDGALVAMDPRTGELLALVGSANRDAPGGQWDMTVAPRNPGNAFRVFTYAAAIASRKYTMVTPVTDAPIPLDMPGGSSYSPRNLDLRYHGTCQLQTCLGNALDVPAVEVEMATGIPAVVGTARALGASALSFQTGPSGQFQYTTAAPAASFGPSLTLGGYGETALQLATATSALANTGTLHQPETILSVRGRDGRSLIHANPAATARQALDPGAAFIVSQMLSDDANRAMVYGQGSPLTLPGRHSAVAAGTTDNFTDAWTVGYTPSLATTVWMGNPNFAPMAAGSDAVFVATPVWHAFMQAALDQLHRTDEWYTPPAGVESAPVGGQPAYFLSGTSTATPAPPLPAGVHVAGAG